MSSLPFLSVSALSSGPVARALLPSPGCLQMPTQLYVDCVDCVYLCVCARVWAGVLVCAYLSMLMYLPGHMECLCVPMWQN